MLTPKMNDALYRLSLFNDPQPRAVCRRIVEILGDFYHGTMAMVNLTQGESQVLCEVVNPHPRLRGISALPLSSTY